MEEIREQFPDGIRTLLLGNKTDEAERRKVSEEEGAEMAEALGTQFLETSAKSGDNVEEAFAKLVGSLMQDTPPITYTGGVALRGSSNAGGAGGEAAAEKR